MNFFKKLDFFILDFYTSEAPVPSNGVQGGDRVAAGQRRSQRERREVRIWRGQSFRILLFRVLLISVFTVANPSLRVSSFEISVYIETYIK